MFFFLLYLVSFLNHHVSDAACASLSRGIAGKSCYDWILVLVLL
jgi:hypothetical protein